MKKKLTQKEFIAVKVLLESGAGNAECSKYFKLSPATISRIKASENWDDYCQILAAIALAQKERRNKTRNEVVAKEKAICEQRTEQEVKPEPAKANGSYHVMSSNYQVNRMIEELKIQNEHLKAISAKLAFIVEALA